MNESMDRVLADWLRERTRDGTARGSRTNPRSDLSHRLGGTPRPRVAGPEADSNPVFSPQGDRVAFVRSLGEHDTALNLTVRPDGSGVTELAKPGHANDQWPVDLTWAPDGRSLVVFEREAPDARVWSVDVMTGQQTELQTPVESWQRRAP